MPRCGTLFLGVLILLTAAAVQTAAASETGPVGMTGSVDPHFEPAPGPLIPVPKTIPPETGRGVHISGLPRNRVPGPSRKGGTYTARILIRTAVRRTPGGRAIWVARGFAKWSGGAQMLMVLGSRTRHGKQWLKVRLPNRPNGNSGWLPRDRVSLTHSPNYLVVDRSRKILVIYGRRGKRQARFRVVVGKPGTPTPVGLFALYDRVRQIDPRGFLGPWAVPLTAHSEKLRRFDGGNGLVALHGRAGASLYDPLGSARSHGCVRMNNSRIRQVIKLTMGTAVRIHK